MASELGGACEAAERRQIRLSLSRVVILSHSSTANFLFTHLLSVLCRLVVFPASLFIVTPFLTAWKDEGHAQSIQAGRTTDCG